MEMFEHYGLYWPRKLLVDKRVKRPNGDDHGLYVLLKGPKIVYVGQGKLRDRIQTHESDWLAPWWDNFCWFALEDNAEKEKREVLHVLEGLLIELVEGTYNSAGNYRGLGKQVSPIEGENWKNDLWKS